MYRGIDPWGLDELARTTADVIDRVRTHSLPAIGVLHSRSRAAPAADIAAATARLESWGHETSIQLRLRADLVRDGQSSRFHPGALLRARFAGEGVFAFGQFNEAFAAWLATENGSRRQAEAAIERIAQWLDQGLFDWDVTNNDLHEIKRTLEGLRQPELDRVLAGLTPRQLERWIAEMGHVINGFSRTEIQDVFGLLAANASGDSLGRIHDAALAAGGVDDLVDLGRAIGVDSSDAVIVEFVRQELGHDLSAQRLSTLALSQAISGIDGREAADRVTNLIVDHDSALPLILVDAVLTEEAARGTPIGVMARSSRGDDLAAAFTTVVSLSTRRDDLRALLEDRGDAHSKSWEPRTSQAEEQLLAAATEFLLGNPEAVFADLATSSDTDGNWTSEYWRRLVDRGDGAAIAGILDSLRGGDTIDLVRFADEGPDPGYPYPHAQNLAFAAATLNRGMTLVAADAKGDIAAIGRIAGVARSVIGVFSSGGAFAEGLIGTGAGWSIEARAAAVGADIETQLAALIDTATTRLRPPDGTDLTGLPDAGNAMLAWTSQYTRLLPFA